jgi:threonine dehydratase
MPFSARRTGLTAEGAAAASLAGLLADPSRGAGPALVILTGSNVAA